MREVGEQCASIRHSNSVPSTKSVLEVLQKCEQIASTFVSRERELAAGAIDKGNSTSSLLDLEEDTNSKQRRPSSSSKPLAARGRKGDLPRQLSQITTALLKDDKVYITLDVLHSYTKIETTLKRAKGLPEIFRLFANKPVPKENSSPPEYSKAKPKAMGSAVPTPIAAMALDVAIEQRNLPLVSRIIDTTFATPAFYRARLVTRTTLPALGLAISPFAAYGIADWAASVQNTMEPSTAKGITLAAILAYIGVTTSTGFVAVTTANDHMERVVWIPGTPLRERWLRDAERQAWDKVACAWGFKDPYLRGEEEGEDWEDLREEIGMRGMLLDKTELLPGME